MVQIKPDFIVDAASRRRAVVLSIDDWQKVLDELDELEDLRLYDLANARDEEEIPFAVAMQEIEAESSE